MKPSRSNSRPAASLLNWASDQQILPAILDGHVEDAQQMLDDALDAIEAAFEARRIALPGKRVRGIETGLASHVGPDHSAALAAVELVIKTMTVGIPLTLSTLYPAMADCVKGSVVGTTKCVTALNGREGGI